MKKTLPVIIVMSLVFLYLGPLSTLNDNVFKINIYLPYIGSIFVFIVSSILISNNFIKNKDHYEIIPLILYLLCAVGIFFVYYPYGFN